jgi:hypothetical protein
VRAALVFGLCAALLALAGCSGDGGRKAVAAGRGQVVNKRPCRKFGPAQRRAIARLKRDVAAIRRAADTPTKDTFKGNGAINRTVDRFLLDQGSLPLDNFTRNHYINLAAAGLTGSCAQCFQALEAERPIVQASLNEPGALPCPTKRD